MLRLWLGLLLLRLLLRLLLLRLLLGRRWLLKRRLGLRLRRDRRSGSPAESWRGGAADVSAACVNRPRKMVREAQSAGSHDDE